ncbi:MAG: OPT/YSL family transporter [Planctomycetota bacterium]|nr:OPT/YSL family transporter [Planctomycetota bacterium]
MPQLTLRSVLLGGLLGMLMSASNLYTTLQIGWSFGVTITACVISYVLFTLLRFFSGGRVGQMSILENNCMASTASAAGASTGATIATMFGAMLLMSTPQAGETSASIKTLAIQPWWLVGTFTMLTALMGVFLAIPMKRQMINHEQLPFPTGIATAETLRSLYSRSREALHKAYALLIGMATGAILGILNTAEETLVYLDRVFAWFQAHLFNIRLPGQIPAAGFYPVYGKSLIGFGFEPSLLLIGAGMITGLRVSLSMLAGSALLYFVFTPLLVGADVAHAGVAGYINSMDVGGGGTIYMVHRWGLWGGTAVMVFSSLTALALQWKTIGRAFASALGRRSATAEHADDLARIEVPTSWMIAGMLPITIGMILIQYLAFNISVWAGLIAVGMSFILSLVASRATGETDTTPIGAMGKVMQLIFAGLAPKDFFANLASAGIGANSASASADLLTDLKSGYLLGANPRRQFLAQFFGVFFGTVASVCVWYLMVPNKAILEKFPAPATNMWFKVAQVLTKGIDSLPYSAKMALLVGSLVGIALPLIEKTLVPPKYRKYFPSAMGLGLAWVVPFANALSFAIGAAFVTIWQRINAKSADTFSIPLAAGFVAGESLLKALIAMAATVVGLIAGH